MTTTESTHQLTQCAHCGRYGWHTTDRCPDIPRATGAVVPQVDSAAMTTATKVENHMPPPAGAIRIDAWEGGTNDRARYFEHAPFDEGDATLTIRGMQYADGRTGRSILIRLSEALEEQDDDLTPLYARRLAAMLHNFADTCEILDEAAR